MVVQIHQIGGYKTIEQLQQQTLAVLWNERYIIFSVEKEGGSSLSKETVSYTANAADMPENQNQGVASLLRD